MIPFAHLESIYRARAGIFFPLDTAVLLGQACDTPVFLRS